MPRRNRSNPLALAVLVSLYEKPMHPYEIAQTLRMRAKHESVRLNYGSLYAVVEALERKNLIVARETVREGNRPPRTVYEITEDGSREMVDWLTDMIGVPAKEYPQFLAGLSFIAALTPDDALAALQLRATTLELQLAQIRATLVAARRSRAATALHGRDRIRRAAHRDRAPFRQRPHQGHDGPGISTDSTRGSPSTPMGRILSRG